VFTDPQHAGGVAPARHEGEAVDAAEHCPSWVQSPRHRSPEPNRRRRLRHPGRRHPRRFGLTIGD
jgi:hypothetical protein